MSDFTLHFPRDFKWGTASAAHQVEGSNTNSQWWHWEQMPGHIINGDKSGLACDWWTNAEADFDRMVEMGLNAHRLSLEWSRIEPSEGRFDDAALDRYRAMLLGLRQRGIEPMVTLHHFSHPVWLEEKRAWEDTDVIVPLFRRYTQRVVRALGDLCDLWCTVNEPNVFAVMGYLAGGRMPPGVSDFGRTVAVLRNLLFAHAAAYETLHAEQHLARVGIAHHMTRFEALRARNPLDVAMARGFSSAFNQSVLDALVHGRWNLAASRGATSSARKLRGTLDWIGLNYYSMYRVMFDRGNGIALPGTLSHTVGGVITDHDFSEIHPDGLMHFMRQLARLKLPIYITENGLPDSDDDLRPRFIIEHLRAVWQAIQFCFDVRGYYHWTLVDNFEWGEGWRMRFGLIGLDERTQERSMRRSGLLYRDIAKAGALSSDVVREYAPELMGTVFR